MIAKSEIKYNEIGSIYTIDSTHYYYSDWYNSLTEFKPIFEHQWGFSFLMPDRKSKYKVHCDSAQFYQNQSYPLNLKSVVHNVISDGLMDMSKISSNLEYHYAYNYAGLEMLSVTKWAGLITDSTFYTYDSLRNEKTKTIYPIEGSTIPNNGASLFDSTYYLPNSNLISKKITYRYDSNTNSYNVYKLWEISYNGTEIAYIDYHFRELSGVFHWDSRTEYDYVGNKFAQQTTYKVLNDSIAGILRKETYKYDLKENLIEVLRTRSIDSDTSSMILLKYDPEGFVKEINEYMDGFGGMFLVRNYKYYYQSKDIPAESEDVFVLLYPNPTQDELYIQSPNKIKQVEIVNLLGQIVLSKNSNTINVGGLAPGEYFARVIMENGNVLEKFIKK